MSKYSDLMAAYFEARERYWRSYREHYDFTKRLVDDELRGRFEIPESRFHYLPLDGEPTENWSYALAGACGFRADGWFHVRFQIDFVRADGDPAGIRPRFIFRLRKRDGVWTIRTREGGEESRIRDVSDQAEWDAFFVEFYAALQRWLSPEGDIPATPEDSGQPEQPVQAEWRRIVIGFNRAQEATDRVLKEHAPALEWLADK